MDQWWSETPQFVTTEWSIRSSSFSWRLVLLAIYPTILQFCISLYITPATVCKYHCVQGTSTNRSSLMMANITPQCGLFASQQCHNNNSKSSHNSSRTANCKDSRFGKHTNIIWHKGMVTHLQSSHFDKLHSVIKIFHFIWHKVHNQPPRQANNIQVMGHRGKNIASNKVVMAGL